MILFSGKVPGDEVALADLKLKPSTKIMMMGTREEEIVSAVKPVLNSHSKIDKRKILMPNGSLMKVESIAECSLLPLEHFAVLLTCIKR